MKPRQMIPGHAQVSQRSQPVAACHGTLRPGYRQSDSAFSKALSTAQRLLEVCPTDAMMDSLSQCVPSVGRLKFEQPFTEC